ncbi:TMEM165/GDT1 family protein [Halostella salina]|uniref:TMEM165/GDT1 family protein n=1 Tax=Halostella salina TaxID=1547897 RepID=UPI000EF79A50|nr:TMEM165/GDT1 family protein [Halostella salina]
MTGWWELAVIAFVAQLTVLPGEKVQFIIAGLSTRYNPLVVVGAAGTAFAGWTAVEILFGRAVRTVLPGVYLDVIAASLFLLFAYLLYRSAPDPGEGFPEAQTDGGVAGFSGDTPTVLGREVPQAFGGFLPIFSMMAVGEFGDKTQIITITLAIEYGASSAIWVGEMLAIIPVSLANAYLFHRFSHKFNLRKAHYAAAGLFAFFGLDGFLAVTTDFSIWETVVETVSTALVGLV